MRKKRFFNKPDILELRIVIGMGKLKEKAPLGLAQYLFDSDKNNHTPDRNRDN
jgi:hypothetical protein